MNDTATNNEQRGPNWLVIAQEEDLPRLRKTVRRLQQAYPGRYDFRINPMGKSGPWEVSVRHRD